VDPNEVRFSQHSISYRFRDGGTIDDLAEGLRTGQIRPEDVPPLRLLEKDGRYFTLDNRRLEAFRRAGAKIPWRMATPEEVAAESWKFTTTNGGVTVRVRGEP
jgi:hypothetical protein